MIGKKDTSELAFLKSGAGLSAMALAISLAAFAGTTQAQTPTTGGAEQQQEVAAGKAESPEEVPPGEDEDIVVTGSLIRGVAPTGSNTVQVSNVDVKLSGAIDSNAALTQLLPQSEGFLDAQRLQPGRGGGSSAGLAAVGPVVRASLRNLGDSFSGSGAPTLVLLNGNRIVPAGYSQSAVDVGIIPQGIIERTEIVLDGTSAVYGSDAVGGTINYIPRTRFEGTRVSATGGVAADYWSTSADISHGIKWDTGGIGLAYSFGKNSDLNERDRDWTIPRNYLPGQNNRLTGQACEGYGTITISGRRFLTTAGLPEQGPTDGYCELGYNTTVQAMERHSAFVTFSQDLTDKLKFDLYGFYSQRKTLGNTGPFTATSTVTSANPFYRNVAALPNATQSVTYQFGPIFGYDAGRLQTGLYTGQISPSLTLALGGDWQVKAMGTYGKSKIFVDLSTLDTTLLATRVAGGLINPYDLAATPNPANFNGLVWQNYEDAITQFKQARVVADGPLFTLPGGAIRVAIGAEWMKTDYQRRNTNTTSHVVNPYAYSSQRDVAVFGEANIPIFSEENAAPGFQLLTVSASARYDNYDNSGGTFNPKLSATWKPVDWITIRGGWGKSFRAPNVVDLLGTQANAVKCSSFVDVPGCTTSASVTIPPGTVVSNTQPNININLSGSDPNIQPEKSTNWSIGGDIAPPFIPGLRLSATYWHINFTNRIGLPPTDPIVALQGAPQLVNLNPTDAQWKAFALQAAGGQQLIDLITAGNYHVMYTYNITSTNLATSLVSGLDLSANYVRETGFGSIDASFNGTWSLQQETQVLAGQPFTNNLRVNVPTFQMSAGLGANIGNLRAQLTYQHRSGFNVDPSATRDPAQTRIGSYSVWNTSFRYELKKDGWLKDTAVTLVVNNLFNAHSPIARTTSGVNANGTTIGRFFQLGIEKSF